MIDDSKIKVFYADFYVENKDNLACMGIDANKWNLLFDCVFPGSDPADVLKAISYCNALDLDILLKPVNLIKRSYKGEDGKKIYFSNVEPGISAFRSFAMSAGDYAGVDAPVFGPIKKFTNSTIEYPEWCEVTVYKWIKGVRCPFTSREYWIENFGEHNGGPNFIWRSRPYGQINKCAEKQALVKAWPQLMKREEISNIDYETGEIIAPVTVASPPADSMLVDVEKKEIKEDSIKLERSELFYKFEANLTDCTEGQHRKDLLLLGGKIKESSISEEEKKLLRSLYRIQMDKIAAITGGKIDQLQGAPIKLSYNKVRG